MQVQINLKNYCSIYSKEYFFSVLSLYSIPENLKKYALFPDFVK